MPGGYVTTDHLVAILERVAGSHSAMIEQHVRAAQAAHEHHQAVRAAAEKDQGDRHVQHADT